MLSFFKDLLQSLSRLYLRPPGALEEERFVATCIKCGRCMEVCPYRSIFLAPYSAGAVYGTPVIDPLKKPCYLCMKCPGVCPTGSLRPVSKEEAGMGRARIIKKTCLSYNITVCNLCFKKCPLRGRAITLDELLRPVVMEGGCVGCGVCTYVCPTEPVSIRIIRRS